MFWSQELITDRCIEISAPRGTPRLAKRGTPPKLSEGRVVPALHQLGGFFLSFSDVKVEVLFPRDPHMCRFGEPIRRREAARLADETCPHRRRAVSFLAECGPLSDG
jgi:hypothetical protein